MKKLLLSLLVAFSGTAIMNGQTTCALATTISTNGTLTTPTMTGTYVAGCLPSATNIKAVWYKYTATLNGEVTLSSDLAINNGTLYSNDTRISVFRGTCAALVCVDDADDVSGTNYKTTITVPVAAGTTYYFQWDNYWQARDNAPNAALGFQFTFNFVASACVRPGANDFYLPDSYTTTSASLYWNPAVGNPANYDTDWSTTFTTAAGLGTIVPNATIVPANGTAPSYVTKTITGLPAGSNFRYFVRSNCGASQSSWQGPYFGYLAKTLPYSNTFDSTTNNNTDGFVGSFQTFTATATTTPALYADGGAGTALYTFNSTTAASNSWGYSRGFELAAGEVVTLTFKTRLWTPTGTPANMNLNVTVGEDQIASAQTTVLQSFVVTGNAAYDTKTVTFTPTVAGVYYFGFNNNSAQATTQTYMFFDTFGATSVLSTKEFSASTFSVYPNPSNDIVNISNNSNYLLNSVNVLDLNGRTVKSVKLNGETSATVNISDLSAGVYMMSINSDQGSVTKKIVKN